VPARQLITRVGRHDSSGGCGGTTGRSRSVGRPTSWRRRQLDAVPVPAGQWLLRGDRDPDGRRRCRARPGPRRPIEQSCGLASGFRGARRVDGRCRRERRDRWCRIASRSPLPSGPWRASSCSVSGVCETHSHVTVEPSPTMPPRVRHIAANDAAVEPGPGVACSEVVPGCGGFRRSAGEGQVLLHRDRRGLGCARPTDRTRGHR
jgi:hypothetical protein